MSLITRIASFLIVSAILYFFIKNGVDFNSWYTYHPTSVSIAFIGILPEIISTATRLQKDKSVIQDKKKKEDLIATHATLAFACKIIGLFGIFAIWHNKNVNGWPHFTSKHGMFGAVSCAALILQVILGVLQNPAIGLSATTRNTLKKIHGYCSYLLTLAIAITFWFSIPYFSFVTKENPSLIWLTYVFGMAAPALVFIAGMTSA